MKFMEKLKKAKKDNKGFSLVELIIVIAIMAILVGIVGTQVIPYINRSKEAKDFQIVNSFSTAAMTAYASNAESITSSITFNVYADNSSDATKAKIAGQIQDLTYAKADFTPDDLFESTKGKTIEDITITITIPATGVGTITTQAVDKDGNTVFDEITSKM